MDFYIKQYLEFSKNEQLQIKNLIISGGEIKSINHLDDRLNNSFLTAIYKDNDIIVATASIKIPDENYKTAIFLKSKSNIGDFKYKFELGYVFVSENFRNKSLASKLCLNLCHNLKTINIFATTRIDNNHMKSILTNNSFKEIGVQFPNRDNTNFLSLYIKPQLIE